MNLQGKAAIVTGASSGIGEATALMLAREGAKVTIAARRAERLTELSKKIEEAGGEALPIVVIVQAGIAARRCAIVSAGHIFAIAGDFTGADRCARQHGGRDDCGNCFFHDVFPSSYQVSAGISDEKETAWLRDLGATKGS